MSIDREAIGPFRMENTFPVNATVGMGTKIIPLGLDQIGRKLKGSIGIEVGERCTHARNRDA